MRRYKYCRRKRWKVLLILFILETSYLLYFFIKETFYEETIRSMGIKDRVFEGCTKRISSLIKSVFLNSTEFRETKQAICDDRDGYFIIRDVFQTSKMRDVWKRSESVTIVTQSTPNYVTALDGLLQRWSGPVSVAIFLCIKDIPEVLVSLFRCRNMMISFHFVAFDWDKETSNVCELIMTTKTDFINQRDVGVSYPYNVLRNVALSAVKSGYIFMIDIDMLTSGSLHDNFLSHIGTISNNIKMTSNNSFSITRAEYMMKFRTAYVIPSFESQSPSYDVKHKYELLPLVGEGFVRPYASASCKHCQKNTNYKKWLSDSEHGAYDIPMSPYHYEPFFILHKSSYPSFNELFKDRGLNRVSQVCETYMSGVNFRVLNSGFLLHRGFRPRRIKDYEKKNYLIYNNMKKTLKLKYDTSRECDVIANYSRIQTTTTKPVLAKPN